MYFPLSCNEDIVHLCEPCSIPEMGRVRSIALVSSCSSLTAKNIYADWTREIESGNIQIIPEVNGELSIEQLEMDGYGTRTKTNTLKDFSLKFNDKNFHINYEFYKTYSGWNRWHIAFRTERSIFVVLELVHMNPNFGIENDLNSVIEWNVELTWRAKDFPMLVQNLEIENIFYCSNPIILPMACNCTTRTMTYSEIETEKLSGTLVPYEQIYVTDEEFLAFALTPTSYTSTGARNEIISVLSASSYTLNWTAQRKMKYGNAPIIRVVSSTDMNKQVEADITFDNPINPNSIVIEHSEAKSFTIIIS